MSTKGGFGKLLLLVLIALVGLLLILGAIQRSGQQLQQEVSYMAKLGPVPVSMAVSSNSHPHHLVPNDTEHEPLDDELVQQLEQELPEVPYGFYYSYAKPLNYRMNSSCAPYSDPLDLQLHNIYWQTFSNANVTFRLYSAYLDDRPGVKGAVVRVLATADQIDAPFPPTHCHLWFEGRTKPTIVEVSEFLSVWISSWGHKPQLSYPHLLSCRLDVKQNKLSKATAPRSVSLVRKPCDRATNSLRVNYNKPEAAKVTTLPTPAASAMNASAGAELSFGVCLKAFDFPYVDLSERLIEWFELQRILGASRIYAYMYDVHPRMQRVLDYYQRSGFLELRPLTLANGMPQLRHYQHLLLQHRLLVKRLNELIPYNDCFYRNMYRHDYLLNVDIDEVIVPKGDHRTWNDAVQTTMQPPNANCKTGHVALCVINTYFTKVISEEQQEEQLFVLQHTLRHMNYSRPGQATKCFHNTRFSLTLHNHFTLKWLSGCCNPKTIHTKDAHMQHYREPDKKYTKAELIEDKSVWKYETELRQQVALVWRSLELDLDQEITPAELPAENEEEMEQEQEQTLEQTSS